jgi:DNA helicase-2/ATP-dependent DNA helicase PcrA
VTDLDGLDAEQFRVVNAPPEARKIVLAPPGSGKTEVVAARLLHLVDEAGLSPFDEIIVLSFSRAAVAAVRNRTASRLGNAGSAVRTIDSLGSLILDEHGVEGWEGKTFDERIVLATQAVKAHGLHSSLDGIRHVILDEVQDVVGVRAHLILEIVRRMTSSVGFTALGDPNQGIFDFQLDEHCEPFTSTQFLESVSNLAPVETVNLLGQYRSTDGVIRNAIDLGRLPASDERMAAMRTFIGGVLAAGDVRTLAGVLNRWSGTTALLCRTNGEALMVARVLRKEGVAAVLRGPAEELPLVPWIGDLLGKVTGSGLRKQDFMERMGAVADAPEDAWRILKGIERDFRSSDRLSLTTLARRLAGGAVPSEVRGGDGRVVVSTIHRAKGLEFDNVVVVNARDLVPADAPADAFAVAYVALTRAKSRLVTAVQSEPKFLRRDKSISRWIVGGYDYRRVEAIEFRNSDVDLASVTLVAGAAEAGKQVDLRVNRLSSDLERPIYDLRIENRTIASSSERFGELLARRLGGPRRNGQPWPGIWGVAVDSRTTVISAGGGPDVPVFRVGLAVSGLGYLRWEDA